MLRIRLRRVGKRGKPSYRIVVANVRAPRDGAYLEWIGNYDPMADPPLVNLKKERAEEWLKKGAQPSDAVKRILHWDGVLEREPLQQTPQRKKAEAEAPAPAPAAPAAATAVAEAPPQAASEDSSEEPEAPEAPTEEVSGGDDESEETASPEEDDSGGGGDSDEATEEAP